ncbi:unnamed protein product [Pedinophyceae sp. YPF-701]|nr:unnamed protein product [Pedinophyceae sp. YPF-701]
MQGDGDRGPHATLPQLLSAANDLKKLVALNYIAVVKACKKRNRLMVEAFGPDTAPVNPLDVLRSQPFFTSAELATIGTQAEILARETYGGVDVAALDDFTCAICLGPLQDPVILSCAHSFCWGCMVAHCASKVLGRSQAAHRPPAPAAIKPDVGAHAEARAAREDAEAARGQPPNDGAAEGAAAAPAPRAEGVLDMFDCPMCRKPQVADINALRVDTELARFIQKLQTLRVSDGAQGHPRKGAEGHAAGVEGLVASHAELVETLRDLVVPHPSHWLSEVQTTPERDEALESHNAEKPAGAPPTLGIKPAEDEAAGAPEKALGPSAKDVRELQQQGLFGPEGGDKSVYGAQLAGREGAGRGQGPLLPPQRAEMRGKLTVVLDLDGTLVSTYTVRRAPRLPREVRSYVVGRGGPLNVDGVFVVERPGLGDFLRSLAEVSEVVLFTAGLEDYAAPIVEAIDPDGTVFSHCLYRPATVESRYYSCVKDLSLLGRDLSKTLLVDDTPLAFLHDPHNGVPVFSFKGDPDDRLLNEAILPLLLNLSQQQDVRPALRRRFQMDRWFLRNGFNLIELGVNLEIEEVPQQAHPTHKRALSADEAALAPEGAALATDGALGRGPDGGHDAPVGEAQAPRETGTVGRAPSKKMQCTEEQAAARAAPQVHVAEAEQPVTDAAGQDAAAATAAAVAGAPPPEGAQGRAIEAAEEKTLLLLDFDQTLIDYDSFGRLLGLLAPDTLPVWMSIRQPQNSVPMSNAICSALQRRGITPQMMERTLEKMGKMEFPAESAELLREARKRGDVYTVVISDCNDWLIDIMLRAAGVRDTVDEVIANAASWAHVSHAADAGGAAPPVDAGKGPAPTPSHDEGAYRLTVFPRHTWSRPPHGCIACPANMCKSLELDAFKKLDSTPRFRRVVLCADGANDLCLAMSLGPEDVVLARRSYGLHKLIQQTEGDAVCSSEGTKEAGVRAHVRTWTEHGDLLGRVRACFERADDADACMDGDDADGGGARATSPPQAIPTTSGSQAVRIPAAAR